MIPKFLICDSHEEPEREFVLHTHFPRFLAEVIGDKIEPIQYYDEMNGIPVQQLARLMSEAGDWYVNEISSYED